MQTRKIRLFAGILAALMISGSLAGCKKEGGESSQASSGGTNTSTTPNSSEPEEVRNFDGAEFVIGSHWATHIFQEPGNSPQGDLILKRIEDMEEQYNCSFPMCPVLRRNL